MTNENLTREEVLKVIERFPHKALRNSVFITTNVEDEDGAMILSDNVLSETQYIIGKGRMCMDINVGDKVFLDLEKLMVTERNEYGEKVTYVKITPVKFEDYQFAIIDDTVIKYVY